MDNPIPSYRLIAACIILIAYFTVAGVLLSNLYHPGSGPAPEWDHVLVVFNAIGALATTAAGVLLGVEIQQANVRAATKDAQNQVKTVERKNAAITTALENLESSNSAATSLDSPVSKARLALQRSLADQGAAL
jgi:hypothetical protein